MRYLLFLIVLLASSCSLATDDVFTKEKKVYADKSIELCLGEYKRLSQQQVPEEIDRIYILVANKKIDLLFTRGEVGTFGERSKTYRSLLFCGVLVSDALDIYCLEKILQDPLVEKPDIPEIIHSGYTETIWDLLFLRQGKTEMFKLAESRVFSIENEKNIKMPASDKPVKKDSVITVD